MWRTTPKVEKTEQKVTQEFILIMWTAPHLDEAREIAQGLVAKKLVACASIIPLVESWFIWEGKLEQASEVKIFLKTTQGRFSQVEKYIKERHSYEVPEILAYPILAGYDPYLKWIEESTK